MHGEMSSHGSNNSAMTKSVERAGGREERDKEGNALAAGAVCFSLERKWRKGAPKKLFPADRLQRRHHKHRHTNRGQKAGCRRSYQSEVERSSRDVPGKAGRVGWGRIGLPSSPFSRADKRVCMEGRIFCARSFAGFWGKQLGFFGPARFSPRGSIFLDLACFSFFFFFLFLLLPSPTFPLAGRFPQINWVFRISAEMSGCPHPAIYNSMCVSCGKTVQEGQGGPANMVISGGSVLQLSNSEAERVQALKIEGLKKAKKLALVLDLDHTLLHAVQVEGPTPSQTVHPGRPDIHHLPIEELIAGTVKHLVMKKRPYLDSFLAQAHEFCQMTVYTAGMGPSLAPSRSAGWSFSLFAVLHADALASNAVPCSPTSSPFFFAACEHSFPRENALFSRPPDSPLLAAGTRRYAEAVVKVLDPTNKYICNRIVSRTDDKTVNNKSLQKIFLHDSSMAVILDDREDVWKGSQSDQLLLVRPYLFFHSATLQAIGIGGSGGKEVNHGPGMQTAQPSNLNAPSPVISLHNPPGKLLKMAPQSSQEYSESDDQLPRCLELLRSLHASYFSPALYASPSGTHSVASILNNLRKDILRDCTITFSGIIPTNEANPHSHFLYRLAESLGATVSLTLQPQTTHLLCLNLLTAKVQAVLQQKREEKVYVLHPDWLIYCKWALARVMEDTFLLTSVGPNAANHSVSNDCNLESGQPAEETSPPRKRKLSPTAAPQSTATSPSSTGIEGNNGKRSRTVVVEEAPNEDEPVVALQPTVLPDMDAAISNPTAQPVDTPPFVSSSVEEDDEGDIVPEPPPDEEDKAGDEVREREEGEVGEEEEEEEGDGDCRGYYDRHISYHYDAHDGDSPGRKSQRRQHPDEDDYGLHYDDEDEVEEVAHHAHSDSDEAYSDSSPPVPTSRPSAYEDDEDEDDNFDDLISAHLNRPKSHNASSISLQSRHSDEEE